MSQQPQTLNHCRSVDGTGPLCHLNYTEEEEHVYTCALEKRQSILEASLAWWTNHVTVEFLAVGIAERMAESAVLFWYAAGWPKEALCAPRVANANVLSYRTRVEAFPKVQ